MIISRALTWRKTFVTYASPSSPIESRGCSLQQQTHVVGRCDPAVRFRHQHARSLEKKVSCRRWGRLRRDAQKRTIDDAWRHIGGPVETLQPDECANYFRNAGYVPTNGKRSRNEILLPALSSRKSTGYPHEKSTSCIRFGCGFRPAVCVSIAGGDRHGNYDRTDGPTPSCPRSAPSFPLHGEESKDPPSRRGCCQNDPRLSLIT